MTAEIIHRLQESETNAEMLFNYWERVMPKAARPGIEQFRLWSTLHRTNVAVMFDAVDITARKFAATGGKMDLDYLTRYASKAANTLQMQRRRPAETKAAA